MNQRNGEQRRTLAIGLKLLAVAFLLLAPGAPMFADEGTHYCNSFRPGCPVADTCEGTTAVFDPNCEIRCFNTGPDPVDTAICHTDPG